MSPAPDWRESARRPVAAGTVVLATAVSLAWWAKADISFLQADPRVGRGELWRLLTSAFPHANLLHLAFNVYWVWVFGTLVESAFGHVRTAAIFALLAVVSGAAEYALFEGGVGLSGVGYGLFGLVWVLSRRDSRFADGVDAQTTGIFVVWFFLCIAMTALGAMNVANVAHGAGALAGGILGEVIAPRVGGRTLPVVALVLLAAGSVLGATVARARVNLSPHPGSGEAHLGYLALRDGRDAEGLRWLTESTTLDPGDARSWFNLGIALQRVGRPRDAKAAYDQARLLEPQNSKYKFAGVFDEGR